MPWSDPVKNTSACQCRSAAHLSQQWNVRYTLKLNILNWCQKRFYCTGDWLRPDTWVGKILCVLTVMNPLFVLRLSKRRVQNFNLAAPRFPAAAHCVWQLSSFVSLQLAKDCYWDKSNRITGGSRVLVSFRPFGFLFRTRYAPCGSMCNPTLSAIHPSSPLRIWRKQILSFISVFFGFIYLWGKIDTLNTLNNSFFLFEHDKDLSVLSTQFFFRTHFWKENWMNEGFTDPGLILIWCQYNSSWPTW